MARINIETSIYARHEFQELMINVGDRQKAKGILQELWELAQKFWFPNKRLIPITEIQKLGLQPVVDSGLAVVDPSGQFVRALGSDEAFAWMFVASEKGRKGGLASADIRKNGTAKLKKKKPTQVDHESTTVNHSQPSLLLSPSSPLSIPDSLFNSKGTLPSVAAPDGVKSPVGFFVANYISAYQQRYGASARPALVGKVQGQIKRFLAETQLDRACELIQTYLGMNDSWFLTKAHDFGTFIENLSKIGLKLDTGKTTTRAEIKNAEKTEGYQSQLDRIAKGTL